MEYAVFTGTSNPDLAHAIAKELHKNVSEATCSRFSDGEVHVQLKESVRRKHCYLVQPTCANGDASVNDSLLELLLLADALKRAGSESITAVIPYYAYGRQDRKALPREPISAALVARMIESAGVDRVVALDLHAAAIEGFFRVPVTHMTSLTLAERHFAQYAKENCVIVSPDEGGVKRASRLADKLGLPMAFLHKARSQKNKSEVVAVVGDVRGKKALVYDDMVDTAGSLCNAAAAMKEQGATEVHAFATHGVLSGAATATIEKSALDSLVVTDSIPQGKRGGKISMVSAAPLLAEAVRRIDSGESISALFP